MNIDQMVEDLWTRYQCFYNDHPEFVPRDVTISEWIAQSIRQSLQLQFSEPVKQVGAAETSKKR